MDQPIDRPLFREVNKGEPARPSISLSNDVDSLDLSEGRQRHLNHFVRERIVQSAHKQTELLRRVPSGGISSATAPIGTMGTIGTIRAIRAIRATGAIGATGATGGVGSVGNALVDVDLASEELDAGLQQRVLQTLHLTAALDLHDAREKHHEPEAARHAGLPVANDLHGADGAEVLEVGAQHRLVRVVGNAAHEELAVVDGVVGEVLGAVIGDRGDRERVGRMQLGHLGHLVHLVHLVHLGQLGHLGHLVHLGELGHLGHLGHVEWVLGHLGHLV